MNTFYLSIFFEAVCFFPFSFSHVLLVFRWLPFVSPAPLTHGKQGRGFLWEKKTGQAMNMKHKARRKKQPQREKRKQNNSNGKTNNNAPCPAGKRPVFGFGGGEKPIGLAPSASSFTLHFNFSFLSLSLSVPASLSVDAPAAWPAHSLYRSVRHPQADRTHRLINRLSHSQFPLPGRSGEPVGRSVGRSVGWSVVPSSLGGKAPVGNLFDGVREPVDICLLFYFPDKRNRNQPKPRAHLSSSSRHESWIKHHLILLVSFWGERGFISPSASIVFHLSNLLAKKLVL